MAYTPPKVWYSSTINGTYTELTQVLSINIFRGRQRFVDPFQGSQCTIELIPANSYSPDLAIGQFLDIRATNSASSPAFFAGRITDVERSYGIPYNASATIAAPADRIIITVTGATGVAANSTFDGTTTLTAGQDAVRQAAVNLGKVDSQYNALGTGPSGVTVSGSSVSGGSPIYDLTNQLLRTAQWVIDDGDPERSTASAPFGYRAEFYASSATGTTITFRDTAGTGYKYREIQYLSSIQQSFNQVAVEPEGLATQYATSGDKTIGYTFSTYDQTTTQAANLAAYVLLIANQSTPAPFRISTSTAVADGCDVLARFLTYPVGTAVTVIFRGTTVNATVQGWQFGFYPDVANVSCFLSPSLGTPFTLDSTAFGVLDTDRLGYP